MTAAALSWVAASGIASFVETRTEHAVTAALVKAGHEWGKVHSDGLQVHIDGDAPTEAARFNALSIAGQIVDAERIIDAVVVPPAQPIRAPEFSIELLRNDAGISLIGLVPQGLDRERLLRDIGALAPDLPITDLLETAAFPIPDGWTPALKYGLEALEDLPRSKITVAAGRVEITAISNDSQEQRRLEAELSRQAPDDLKLSLTITAPRPVVTPFTLRFLIAEDTGPRFDACSVDTEAARARVIAAARAAGLTGKASCVVGLGAPTPDWADAVEQAIGAVQTLGGGSVSFSDADVTLVALDTTPRPVFDRVVGELESNLPDLFSLHSVLPEPVEVDGTGEGDGPVEFVATRSPEGQVQIRGRISNETERITVESFARARFGTGAVYAAARVDEDLPPGWSIRVLAGLQALSELNNGSVVVQPDYLELRGVTGNPEARAEVSRVLGEKLGEGQNYTIDVKYEKALDPIANLPTPQECISRITAVQEAEKIAFAPGSVTVEGASIKIIDQIADILKECHEVEMQIEIGGHTDSQGREVMNQQLSQSRANAVLDALMARRVRTSGISAKGFGEEVPIADNDTEAGREANRRIEFRLITETVSSSGTETADAAGEDGGADAATAETEQQDSGEEATE